MMAFTCSPSLQSLLPWASWERLGSQTSLLLLLSFPGTCSFSFPCSSKIHPTDEIPLLAHGLGQIGAFRYCATASVKAAFVRHQDGISDAFCKARASWARRAESTG